MAYTLDFAFQTGAGGLTDLRAQLVNTTGASVGAAISTGFSDVSSGWYLWHYAAIPDGHRGGVRIYSNASPAVTLYFATINPQAGENSDAKTSVISASVASYAAQHGGNMAGFVYIRRGNTMAEPISGWGDLTGYVTVDFTVKANVDDDDSAAILRIRKNSSGLNDGLMTLNGASGAGVTAADGSLTMPSDLTTGIIIVNLIPSDTKQFIVSPTRVWDGQVIKSGGLVTTPVGGTCVVQADVTRLTS